MKTIVILAWRNIWRNKRRSLVVISAVALGIIAMMLSMGIMNAMNGQMLENTISTSLGHIAIHRAGFQDAMNLDRSFQPGPEIIAAVERTPRLRAWAPRVKVQGIARSSETSQGILLVGVDPEKERRTTKLYDYTLKNSDSVYLTSTSSNDVLISENLAKKLNLLPGDKLVLMVQDAKREITGSALRICGLYRTPVESFDRYMVFAGIDLVRDMTGLGAQLSELSIVLADRDLAPAAKRFLRSAAHDPSLEVLTWMDMAPSLVSVVKVFDTMMYIFFSIIFITVIFSVVNTLIMAVMERFREIGVMKSIGTRPYWVFAMILLESFLLCLTGLAAGIAAGALILWPFSIYGIDLSMFSASMRWWGTGSILFPYVKGTDIAAGAIIVLMTAVLASLYPAFKAARIRPLDAITFI